MKLFRFFSKIMYLTMIRMCDYLQVFYTVIKFVFIYVMDMFRTKKRSFEMFFHYKSMLWPSCSVSMNKFIPISMNSSCSLFSSYYMKSAVFIHSHIMYPAKTITVNMFVTITDIAYLRFIKDMKSTVLPKSLIMLIAKSFSVVFMDAIINRTYHNYILNNNLMSVKENNQ